MKKILPLATLLILAYAVIFLLYGKVLLNPSSYLMEDSYDGLKNYYTFAYYLKHDAGDLIFDGFLHPYGEHIVFTDNHPILAVFLKWVDNTIYPVGEHGVAIINLAVYLSIGVCALFVYLILLKLRVKPWFAVIMALLITFLSPQIIRSFAHYSLSYTFFIPMVWYFLLQYEDQKRKWLWGVLLFGSCAVMGLIHLYYLLMSTLFILAYVFIKSIANFKTIKKDWKGSGILALIGVLPLISILVLVGMTNPYTDRISEPYGFFHYYTRFEGVFFPVYSPFKDIFHAFIKYKDPNGESWASVGTLGFLVLVLTVARVCYFVLKGQFKRIWKFTTNKNLNIFLWSSILVLLFSAALPFRLELQWVVDYFPKLKQFRSLGRLAWVFYYVFAVYMAYFFHLVYQRLRHKQLYGIAISFVVIFGLVWGLEAYINATQVGRLVADQPMFRPNTVFKEAPTYIDSLAAKGYPVDNFQAILPIPYFQIGSEKLSIWRDATTFKETIKLSYHTGLPIFSVHGSRTSVSNALKNAQLLSTPYIEKEILKDLSDEPILICYHNPPLYRGEDEQYVLSLADSIYAQGEFTFYELTKEDLSPIFDKIKANRPDSLYTASYEGQPYQSTDSSFIVFDRFDHHQAPATLRGEGAMYSDTLSYVLFDDHIPYDSTYTNMELSVWIYMDTIANAPNLYYQQIAPSGMGVTWRKANASHQTDIFGNWVKITMLFDNNTNNRHYFHIRDAKRIIIDDFLIRPVDIDVYWQGDSGGFIFNNYEIF